VRGSVHSALAPRARAVRGSRLERGSVPKCAKVCNPPLAHLIIRTNARQPPRRQERRGRKARVGEKRNHRKANPISAEAAGAERPREYGVSIRQKTGGKPGGAARLAAGGGAVRFWRRWRIFTTKDTKNTKEKLLSDAGKEAGESPARTEGREGKNRAGAGPGRSQKGGRGAGGARGRDGREGRAGGSS